MVPYVPSILLENQMQRSSTFWHSSDLRVLGSFLYAIHCLGVSIRVQKTKSMSHRLQRFVVTFHHHLHHIFLEVYRQCLHVGVFHFLTACGAPIGPRSFSFADLPFKFDELTCDSCPTHEQFHHMNIFCHRSAVCQHFPHFHRSLPTKALRTGACCYLYFAHCLTHRVIELYGNTNSEPTSSSAFTLPSLNLNIYYLFVAHQPERTIRHDSFVNDIIFM